ncbi:YwqJ-related putative deaminase [Clostridium sp.]|mgnify:FL=1|uniref:YwqJ-related putative deaminase n=1 Tax=Clostridium sp. TaxID=1506 RepID=UPI0026186D21|nr:YwqJ-related putative deaminase [uncultured Clostridium sp.]
MTSEQINNRINLRVYTHAEVYALNEALLARNYARLCDFMVHVISVRKISRKIPAGVPMAKCPHCEYITIGSNYFPEVLKYGK